MNWFKKHWNDPITVGGYTKMCIWCTVISFVAVAIEIVWFMTDMPYKITNWFTKIVHKIKRV